MNAALVTACNCTRLKNIRARVKKKLQFYSTAWCITQHIGFALWNNSFLHTTCWLQSRLSGFRVHAVFIVDKRGQIYFNIRFHYFR